MLGTDMNYVKIRVSLFANVMIQKFKTHESKGGWKDMNTKEGLQKLLQCLKDEVKELEEALESEPDEDVIKEAADVANYALILSDLVSRTKR